jgi:hypothetical protein
VASVPVKKYSDAAAAARHAVEALHSLCTASPSDYTKLSIKEGALSLVAGAMRGFPSHPQLQMAACCYLDHCAALPECHEMLLREHAVPLCCTAIRTITDHIGLLCAAYSVLASLATSTMHHAAIQVRADASPGLAACSCGGCRTSRSVPATA